MSDQVVPKKPKEEHEGDARPRTLWMKDDFWAELQLAAKREGYSTGKFVIFLIKAGWLAYKQERLAEEARAGKSAPERKP